MTNKKPKTKQVKATTTVQPEGKVEIQVNRNVVADIGPHHVDLVVGQTYSVVTNVRDVLFEAGYLATLDT